MVYSYMTRLLLLALLAIGCLIWSGPSLADDAKTAPPKGTQTTTRDSKKETVKGDAVTSDKQQAGEKDKAAADEPKFIRIRRNDKGQPVAMETAVVHYIGADGKRPGVSVDLVGAIHIADKSYYAELNKLFETYEVVLYELVAPEGTRIPKEGREGVSSHPLGAMQQGMGAMLELTHQLNGVDYTKENFVHADMSPEDFAKSMEKRGESFMQMFLRLMGQGMAQQAAQQQQNGGNPDLNMLMALFSKDRARKLKVMLADQFENLEGQMVMFDGPEGSTIITERNKKALEVLDKQLKEGKKHIAIFYGAGHLPDMEKRLAADFGLKRESEKWLVAWSMEAKK
jgi:hypothetical protein